MSNEPTTFRLRPLAAMTAAAVMLMLAGCDATLHHRRGMVALDKREYADAVRELALAAEKAPTDVEYRRDWLRTRETITDKLLANAATAHAEGKDAEAAKAYSTILQFDAANTRALAGLELVADIARANADAVKAREAFKRSDMQTASELVARVFKVVPGHAEARAVKRDIEALQAQEAVASPSLGAMYRKPINLEFREASLKFVFDALSRTTGINFIFDRDVKSDQRTTLFLKNTTLDDAIDVILSTAQLEKKVLNPSSVLIYPNTSTKNKEYQDLLVKAFYTANVEAKQAAAMLKTVLKIKDIFVDDKYNMLILRENPETIALATKLLALHDLEEPEVMLEVEVLEINRTRLLNLGVQWSSQFSVAPLANGTTSGSTGSSGGTAATMKLSDLKALTSSGIGITVPTATLNLTKSDGDANLLANPRIRVRDREKAKILIGDKVPVVTTTTAGTFVTENIQYLDVGLKLDVEPDIHLRDEIGLKLSLEVSSLVSSIKTSNGSQAYQIGTRNFNSALRLKDGETQILAGLISDEDRSSASKLPLVGDLPLVGRLFGSQNDNRNKTEIVLSITPHLIRNMQRKDASAESFWSGTEATLSSKPLRLRNFDAAAGAAVPASTSAPGTPGMPPALHAPQQPASSPDAPKLQWQGPASVKAGEVFTLQLSMDSPEALRAASLQLAFNPAEFEIVSIGDGAYFGADGKGTFSHTIDNPGGRASLGASGTDTNGIKGAGKLLSVQVKAKSASPGAQISVIGMTPIGAQRAISRPGLPYSHQITVTP